MSTLAPLEIQALAKIIDELDYYQILHLEPDASGAQVKQAYYQTSRTFHPDANQHLDPALLADCKRIAKRLTEAYCVLRDPRRRRAYDERRGGTGGGVRMQLAEARAADAQKQSEIRQGRTPQGRQFFQKAMAELEAGRVAGAISNLQMALTFEADNQAFKEKLEELRKLKR